MEEEDDRELNDVITTIFQTLCSIHHLQAHNLPGNIQVKKE